MPETFVEADRLEQVVKLVAPGSTLLRSWPLQGGISAQMTAFEVQRPGGQSRKMILRRPSEQALQFDPCSAEDEFRVLQLTASLGLATQTPYFLDRSGTIFPEPYLVIEYVEGTPEFPSSPPDNFTSQLARHLAMIHCADYSKQDVTFLPKAADECVEVSRRTPTKVQNALEVHQIRERLENCSFLPQRNQSTLLHGDFWPGNILWRGGTITAVIDWEDAQLGDPLIDFAISRLDILWIFGFDAFQSFTRHYQSLMDIDYAKLPYCDLCAALRLARLIGAELTEWTAFFIPLGRHDITEHTLSEHFRYFTTQALEKLAIQ